MKPPTKQPVQPNPPSDKASGPETGANGPDRAAESPFSDTFTNLDVKPEDIGGELLPILSKGLYTNPLHAIREYVQNSVDANAKNVSIQFTGNAVLITDDGDGMRGEDLIQARRFGVSHKNSQDHVGFRGIGVYSGFDLCNRLLISSSIEGEPFENVLVFDFGGMKKVLKQAQEKSIERPPLYRLLRDFSQFKKVPADESTHGTTVQLEDVDSFHLGQLKNEDALRRYILKTLPIAFDERFVHRDEIQGKLAKEVPGFKAVRVVLEIIPGRRIVVAKPAILNLSGPVFKYLHGPTGKTIGVIWSCLNGADGTRKRIPDGPDETPKDGSFIPFHGFVYKVKGFTIGDNHRLLTVFTRKGLYSWYTGEVYVIDEDVRPNTERNDFESSPAYDYLKAKVEDALTELETDAGTFQAQGKAAELYTSHNDRVAALDRDFQDDVGKHYEQWSELNTIVEDLKKQRNKLAPDKKEWGREILKKATALRESIQKRIDKPEPRRRSKGGSRTAKPENDSAGESTQDMQDTTLVNLVEDIGVELTEQTVAVLAVIDEAIASVLFRGSSAHKAVIEEIARQLERSYGESD